MMKLLISAALIASLISCTGVYKEYHVAMNGDDSNSGTLKKPFLTINEAVKHALPGDTITVHSGIYREWVNPLRGGESDEKRIVFRAASGEKAEIRGSEVITGWGEVQPGVWKVSIPGSFFVDYNPFRDSINGDWFYDHGWLHHTGEVFLNGKSLYEKDSLSKVMQPQPDKGIRDPEGSTYAWYCESHGDSVIIWANFHGYDPNKEMVEISARRTCFYPDKPGINYITLSGFIISQAATQWGAPTAEQVGMISTNWNKGWIIENNIICNSKCSGITLGKERNSGHNVWSADKENVNRDGNIHYIEVVFRVLRMGWNKDNIGSHIVRNNEIFNCEQTGICGSMGAAFSIIENNHIHDIFTKRQFSGAEIGGIKFHAAVDAIIRNNRIHDTGRGIWLDWMTQGTRVSKNIFYNNDMEDLFFEVNHGPFLVDHNIFLSPNSIRTQSEGGAYVHNLITGYIFNYPDPGRFTPYFLAHSTSVAGLTTIMGGDDRYYNNIFVGKEKQPGYGLAGYNDVKLPCTMAGNVYYNGSVPSSKDTDFLLLTEYDPGIMLETEGEQGFLVFTPSPGFKNIPIKIITSEILGKARIPKTFFENPDGSLLSLDSDFYGNKRNDQNNSAGPFIAQGTETLHLKLW